jgi:hypothetical protein
LSCGLARLQPGAVTGAWYGSFAWTLPEAKILWEQKR